MKKNTLIEDGILEQYLLGELSKAEMTQVESFLKEDETLRAHFDALEKDFEQMAFENAIEPSDKVKEQLLSAINKKAESKVKEIQPKKRFNYLPVAASIAFIFMLLSVYMFTQWQGANYELKSLQDQTNSLTDRLNEIETRLDETQLQYNVINNPQVIPLRLVGNEKMPNAITVIYLNHSSQQVMLNSQGMPALSKDKDYQLWADVDGEMIDMGVIPTQQQQVMMKYIPNASSINITIEPAGGNDHATVEQLISNVIL